MPLKGRNAKRNLRLARARGNESQPPRKRNKQPEKPGIAPHVQTCKTEPPARKGTRVPLPADLRPAKHLRAAYYYLTRQPQRPANTRDHNNKQGTVPTANQPVRAEGLGRKRHSGRVFRTPEVCGETVNPSFRARHPLRLHQQMHRMPKKLQEKPFRGRNSWGRRSVCLP